MLLQILERTSLIVEPRPKVLISFVYKVKHDFFSLVQSVKFQTSEKVKSLASVYVYLFENGTKLKILSEINPTFISASVYQMYLHFSTVWGMHLVTFFTVHFIARKANQSEPQKNSVFKLKYKGIWIGIILII